MGLPLLLAGLILLLAGTSWFAAAATVGLILTIAGGVLLALQLILWLVAAKKVNDVRRDISRDWPGRF